MALVKCNDCGKEISKKAKACPDCGSPPKKKTSLLTWLVALCLLYGFVNGFTQYGSNSPPPPQVPETKEEKEARMERLISELKSIPKEDYENNLNRYKQLSQIQPENKHYIEKVKYYTEKLGRYNSIKKQFSSWDGSHRNLEQSIKNSMNDPDSYEHVETKYIDKGSHLVVVTTFRGRNSFGGKVINKVTAKVDLNGSILEAKRN